MLRYLICVVLGLGLVAAALTLTGKSVLALVEIGNCATHPTLVSTRECPDIVAPLILLVFGALLAMLLGGATYWGRASARGAWSGGPNWGGFWWPALFLGGAAMFWDMRQSVAPGSEGQIVWWVFASLAGMFALMGAVPLLIARRRLPVLLLGGAGAERGSLITPGGGPAPSGFPGQNDDRLVRLTPGGSVTLDLRGGAGSGDLARSLDVLARLHSQGALSDTEFAAAKQRLLRSGDDPGAGSSGKNTGGPGR